MLNNFSENYIENCSYTLYNSVKFELNILRWLDIVNVIFAKSLWRESQKTKLYTIMRYVHVPEMNKSVIIGSAGIFAPSRVLQLFSVLYSMSIAGVIKNSILEKQCVTYHYVFRWPMFKFCTLYCITKVFGSAKIKFCIGKKIFSKKITFSRRK